jgi:acyl-CoA reductase-like NAD-dependent aldehyde dehydrogenase
VTRLALFGSYARGRQTEASDADTLVEVAPSIGLRFVDRPLLVVTSAGAGWRSGSSRRSAFTRTWSPAGPSLRGTQGTMTLSIGGMREMNTGALDEAVRTLKAHKDVWANFPLQQKRNYLSSAIARQAAVAADQVRAALEAKGVAPGPVAAEDWSGGPYCVVRYLQRLKGSLEEIEAHGVPQVNDSAIRIRSDGQVVVRVFPATGADRVLYKGFRGEVWMKREVTLDNLRENMAGAYRRKDPVGKVALVLGAGNVSSIGPLDVLTKLYLEGQVCLLKLNPVNEYLAPFIEEVFADLVRDGFVRVVTGGAEVGEYLCQNADIDEIHITGSHVTHDAIVYGSGESGVRNKREGTPRLTKRITSELGNISPIIVVPGPWSASDLRFQAENIATQMINNCGFNCCAAKVLILPRDWPLGPALMEQLKTVLTAIPPRWAYYPGAEDRYDRFVSANRAAQAFGSRQPGKLPWTIIPDLDPEDSGNPCFATESFCGLMAQTTLDAPDPTQFLLKAVAFCNERLWGTLSACILIHPQTEQAMGSNLEAAIAELKYGTIGINHWPVLSFVWGSTTWGAFPGHSCADIQSGIGVVHNAHMFDNPERSVIYGPFRMWPRAAWFVTNRNGHNIFPTLVRMEARPGVGKVLGVMLAAMSG